MKYKVGDPVQLLKVDHPFNNAYGRVIASDAGATTPLYRIYFNGPAQPSEWFPEICVVDDRRNWFKSTAVAKPMTLPEHPAERKGMPIVTGVLDYFPLAIAEVAKCSKAGNDQHNPGQPLHWARDKSTDHADCIARHLIDRGSMDTDGIRHSAKLAWRALAALQLELEGSK